MMFLKRNLTLDYLLDGQGLININAPHLFTYIILIIIKKYYKKHSPIHKLKKSLRVYTITSFS